MNLGMGVMIGLLGGNKDTVEAIKSSLGKKIKNVWQNGDALKFEFEDGTRLSLWDDGQSCCESRYMTTDDNLSEYVGATLLDFELKDGGSSGDGDGWGGEHEIQFLDVKTSEGMFQMATHNEHNGYYGGFYIVARNN